MAETPITDVIPIAEERLIVEKKRVETSRIGVSVTTTPHDVHVSDVLNSEKVSIESVPVGEFVDYPPEVRQEGDVTIIPVLEEVLVKRLRLREEIRVTRRRESQPVDEIVSLRRQEIKVERSPPPTPADEE